VRTTAYSPLLALFGHAPSLRRAQDRTLSVYLPAHAEGYDAGYYDIVFGDLLHRYRERLSDKELDVMMRELPRIRSRMGILRPAGCAGLAAFAESATELMEIVKLPLQTEERLEIGAPLLAPALRQLEVVPPALVAVVDKEQARTFGLILDDIFEIGDLAGGQVKHSKAGGTSALSNQRKADNRARANLEVVAGVVTDEMSSGAYQYLYIAGPQEARAAFEKELPGALQHVIAGHIGVSLDSATLEADIRRHFSELRETKRPS
jgi:hypothetical protein